MDVAAAKTRHDVRALVPSEVGRGGLMPVAP